MTRWQILKGIQPQYPPQPCEIVVTSFNPVTLEVTSGTYESEGTRVSWEQQGDNLVTRSVVLSKSN